MGMFANNDRKKSAFEQFLDNYPMPAIDANPTAAGITLPSGTSGFDGSSIVPIDVRSMTTDPAPFPNAMALYAQADDGPWYAGPSSMELPMPTDSSAPQGDGLLADDGDVKPAANPKPDLRGFPSDVIAAAQATQRSTGIPTSITLAQWALESGWGKQMPPGSNNPFGIKAVAGQPSVRARTREETPTGKSYYITPNFRKFPSMDDAFRAHAQVLTSDRFAKAREKLPDVDAFADSLTQLYGTSKKYGESLRAIIHQHRLDLLDK